MKTLGIFLFKNVEVLDFAGPFEVFSVGSQIEGYKDYKVVTFSEDGLKISAVNGLSVNPDYSIDNLPQLDFLVIPGGDGTKQVIQNEQLMKNLKELIDLSKWTMTVCSGSRIPAKLGLLDKNPFCTHHSVYESISSICPSAIPHTDRRFIQSSEKLYTSAGITAGIDLSFYLLQNTFGKPLATATAKYMEYEAFN